MLTIPAVQDMANQNLTNLQASLNQTSPLNSRAFLRVLSVMEALAMGGLYKYGAQLALQVFAMSATGPGLDAIGAEFDCPRKLAVPASLTVTLPATTGVTLPSSAVFSGAPNGLLYDIQAAAVSVLGVATFQVTCESAGSASNLNVADTLNIVSQVPGASTVAAVTVVTTTGADAELDDDYRVRILLVERATQGGGNATDYRTWAEAVAGVVNAYPYAGKPPSLGLTSYPGDRTVYIECETSINVNGIPTSGLLTEVAGCLAIDPNTGLNRPTLGLTSATLYVEPIIRTAFSITINDIIVPSGQLANVQAAILSEATLFFLAMAPYVLGVDLSQDENDTVTSPLVNQIVQDVLSAMGSSASAVLLYVGSALTSTYRLSPGEKAMLGTITYATV